MRVQREAASSHHAQGKLRRPTVGYQRHILISSTSALCTHREAPLKGIFVHPLVQPRASLSLAQPHTHRSQPQTKRTGRCPYSRLTINYPMCVYCQEKEGWRGGGGWKGRKAAVTYWSAWWSCRPGLTRWPWVTLNICKHTHTHTQGKHRLQLEHKCPIFNNNNKIFFQKIQGNWCRNSAAKQTSNITCGVADHSNSV